MRARYALIPLALVAAPASAQPAADEVRQIQVVATDPATAQQLSRMLQVMTKAFLNLPAGELQAAAEGRQATRQERSTTVRDVARRDNPNFERDLQQQTSAQALQGPLQALGSALPAMMQAMTGAMQELEKAATNIPSPAYPKR